MSNSNNEIIEVKINNLRVYFDIEDNYSISNEGHEITEDIMDR